MKPARLAAAAIAWLALAACRSGGNVVGSEPVVIPPSPRLLLDGVTVVDVRAGALVANASVLAEGGEIVSVAPSGSLDASGAQVVDLAGKFVVPGYNDMHAHVLGHDDDPSSNLGLMLANGITGFRQMQGSPWLLEQRAAGVLPLTADAPALLAAPGQLLTPFNARNADVALGTLHAEVEQGADFIKIGLVNAEVFEAVLAEAKRSRVRTAGHVPPTVDVLAASRLGFGSIEHLGPSPGVALACSSEQETLLAQAPKLPPFLNAPPFSIPFADRLVDLLLRKRIVNTVVAVGTDDLPRLRRVIDTYSEPKCRAVAAQFAAQGTWHVPTLVRSRASRYADAPEYSSDPNLRYVSAGTLSLWREVAETFEEEIPPDARQVFRDGFALDLKILKVLDEGGVRLLTGSDVTGAGWLVPGFSLHQEFDLLAQAGLPPRRVLQMTTLAAAEFLGSTATMGTVEAGKRADLVVLDANPLDDVQNLHRIHAVVRAGHYHGPEALEALKRRAAAAPGDS